MELQIANRADLIERVSANLDDLYVFSELPDAPTIEHAVMGDNHLVVIAPRGHRLVGRAELRWADIAEEQFIVRENGSGSRAQVEVFLQKQGWNQRHQMTVASNEAIKHAVLAKLGLAIVPTLALDEGDSDDIVQLPVNGFPIQAQWHLVWRREKTLSVVAETFQRYVMEEGCAMLGDALSYWEEHRRPKLPTT